MQVSTAWGTNLGRAARPGLPARRGGPCPHTTAVARPGRKIRNAAAAAQDPPASAAGMPDFVKRFVEDPTVQDLLKNKVHSMRSGVEGNDDPVLISDLFTTTDADGNLLPYPVQWVQLVMAGGGMLGVAHVGFVYVLEEAGIRFLGLGGTSAGSTNAGLMAAVRRSPTDISWDKTLKAMADPGFSFGRFEDGDSFFKQMRNDMTTPGRAPGFFGLIWRVLTNKGKLEDAWGAMGVHKGDTLRNWLAEKMAEHGVHTKAELEARLGLGGIRVFERPSGQAGGQQQQAAAGRDVTAYVAGLMEKAFPLKLVASEVSTQSKIVFPEDAHLFYQSPADASPADFIRASMSVPIFFRPFRLPQDGSECQPLGPGADSSSSCSTPKPTHLPNAGNSSQHWMDACGYEGNVPDTAVFVDGGTLSNFPIALFHDPSKVPLMPTVGIQLGVDRKQAATISNPVQLVAAMNDSSRHLSDREFLEHNKDYKNLVQTIDCSGFNWLNFDMPEEDKRRLFLRGVVAAVDFLEGWRESGGKWEQYKQLRQKIAKEISGDA